MAPANGSVLPPAKRWIVSKLALQLRGLTADLRHGAVIAARARTRISPFVINLGFELQQISHPIAQHRSRNTLAQRCSQVNLPLLIQQAGPQPAIRREPHAVAAIAKTFRHLTNKPDRSQSARYLEHVRWPIAQDLPRAETPAIANLLPNFCGREPAAIAKQVAIANGHKFNEPYVPVPLQRQRCQIEHFVIINAGNHDDVEFERIEADAVGGLNSFPDLLPALLPKAAPELPDAP
jgi:hypothetical protein